ncbi:uncharacterized protein BDW47DRAFT_111987 [Aspergillus candidus]|uniref:Secreted protein n=1 Tax=Aspergillus candidus TaxID=41067 RepID=A0A2I2F1V6_ASPCN|nr:hypothetical protein BDW47DRAFT_111987 [Aspergillus candidus]PLB34622.1 hypothetical protein BDW47DRAFT_111987 [Aspergillus candidus]
MSLSFFFPLILCFLITSRERQASREYVCSCLLRRYRTKRPQLMNLAIFNPFHANCLCSVPDVFVSILSFPHIFSL